MSHPALRPITLSFSTFLLALLLPLAAGQTPIDTWEPGDIRLFVPETQEPGGPIEIPVKVETGGALLAALTFEIRWNPAAATLVEVRGGLSPNATHPFVINDREVGRLVISDINAPQKVGAGGAAYNNLMRGRIDLYTVVLRRTSDAPLALRAEVTAFHDPGDGNQRHPTAIGNPLFPRPARVIDPRAGNQPASDERPLGEVWHTDLLANPVDAKHYATTLYAQLGSTPLGSFSLELRYDPKQLEPASVVGASSSKPSSDWSIPGTLWISGSAANASAPDGVGNVALATVTFRALGADPTSITGQVVSLHLPRKTDEAPQAIGALALPRAIAGH